MAATTVARLCVAMRGLHMMCDTSMPSLHVGGVDIIMNLRKQAVEACTMRLHPRQPRVSTATEIVQITGRVVPHTFLL